jgi:CRP/FNR family transcriptional regulator
MRSLFSSEPAVQKLLLEGLTSMTRNLLVNLDELLTCSLSERLQRFLSRNSDETGCIAMTHQMLASHLGVAREAVSREIAVLKEQKKVSTGRGYLQLKVR